MSRVVLDASAVLALLNAEPGADKVKARLGDAAICTVNLSEVAAVLIAIGVPRHEARAAISALPIASVPFSEDLAYAAAALRPVTKAAGLSLGDRACLALAASLGASALTADRAWANLDVGAEVELIR